jgi:hypothetical protein
MCKTHKTVKQLRKSTGGRLQKGAHWVGDWSAVHVMRVGWLEVLRWRGKELRWW